jgi:hypothetical protein
MQRAAPAWQGFSVWLCVHATPGKKGPQGLGGLISGRLFCVRQLRVVFHARIL